MSAPQLPLTPTSTLQASSSMMEVPAIISYRYPQDHDFEDSLSHMDDFPDCNHSTSSSSSSMNYSNSRMDTTHPNTSSRHHQQQQQQQQHLDRRNVRVQVGGETFSFPQSIFQQKFLALPWKCDMDGVFHLNCIRSPAVFEVLLDYALFGTLPAYDILCDEEFVEFELVALAMGYHDLVQHFDRKDSYLAKELRQGRKQPSASGCDSSVILNPATRSPTSVAATRCVRFLGALCGGVMTTPSVPIADLNAKRFKVTHGEWVASQNVS